MDFNSYYTNLLKVKSKEDLEKLNKNYITCNNDTYVLTQESFDRSSDIFIPLIYNNIWLCFSFEEIFDILYNYIIDNNLIYIPDPFLSIFENISTENENIIFAIDKIFYNGILKKEIEKNRKSIDIMKFLSIEDINNLKEISKDIPTDPEKAINFFLIWYSYIKNTLLKISINNFIVKSSEGNKITFKLLLDKYIKNPTADCSRELKLALKSFLDFILSKKQGYGPLNVILEEEEM